MDFLQSLLNGLPGSVGQGLMWGLSLIHILPRGTTRS